MPDSAIDGIFESAGEHSRQLISERSEQADRAVKLARSREAEARLDAAKRHEAEQMRKQGRRMEAQRALHEDEEPAAPPDGLAATSRLHPFPVSAGRTSGREGRVSDASACEGHQR